MKTYSEFMNEIEEPLDESALHGIAVERKLKAALQAVKATDDANEKLDILMKALHFGIGSIALNLTKTQRRK